MFHSSRHLFTILCLGLILLSFVACQNQQETKQIKVSAYDQEPAFKEGAGDRQSKMWTRYEEVQQRHGAPLLVMFVAEQQGLIHRPADPVPAGLDEWPMTEIRMYYKNATMVIRQGGESELRPPSPHMIQSANAPRQ